MGEQRSSRRAVSIIFAASYLNFPSNDPSDIREAATTATATQRHLKIEFALPQTLSPLFHLV